MMQTLNYHAEPKSTWAVSCVLWMLPFAVAGVMYIGLANMAGEPFVLLTVQDVAIFVGGPIAIAVCAGIWIRLAIRHRVPWLFIVVVVGWFVLDAWIAVSSLLTYLKEPWNQ